MEKKLTPKTLRNCFNQWFFWNGCSQQAETMLGIAFAQSMAPAIDQLYEKTEDRADALLRHTTLFNTESQVGSICNGITLGMEEQLANGNGSADAIVNTKVALIGPTSAIGDSLWVATVIPLLLTICLSLTQSMSQMAWIGPVLYMIIYPFGTYQLSWRLFNTGYKAGLDGIQQLFTSGKIGKLIDALTVMGLLVVGGLTASFVTAKLNIDVKSTVKVFDAANSTYADQIISVFNPDTLLDNVFPKLLPLALTLLVYHLYAKKNWKPIAIMGLILVLAIIVTVVGFIPGVGALAQ